MKEPNLLEEIEENSLMIGQTLSELRKLEKSENKDAENQMYGKRIALWRYTAQNVSLTLSLIGTVKYRSRVYFKVIQDLVGFGMELEVEELAEMLDEIYS